MATAMPKEMSTAIREVQSDAQMREGIEMMLTRVNELSGGELAATLIGIAAMPTARRHLDQALDAMWANRSPYDATRRRTIIPEVVVGAGLHGAIYCAVRVLNGHPKPVVLEGSDRVGGAIGCTNSSTFYLNSRNRPGKSGTPGDQFASLNYIPGAPIQPSDLSADEYQRNNDLGFIIRVMLAMYADVHTGAKVLGVDRRTGNGTKWRLSIAADRSFLIETKRCIFAAGLGGPKYTPAGPRVLSFDQFMKHMDSKPFPMRGIERAAVIGAGDGGKVVIEALTGQGPSEHMSMASMDYVRTIDWLDNSGTNLCVRRADWLESARPRYAKIAQLLPRYDTDTDRLIPARIDPQVTSIDSIASGYEAAYVNEKAYDLVVDCRGYDGKAGQLAGGWSNLENMANYTVAGRILGRRYAAEEMYRVGPCAQIERQTGDAAGVQNQTALFRYADRTAMLAASLS